LLWVSARHKLRTGSVVLCYLGMYAFGRFLLELIRTDTTFRLFGLSRNAYVSLAVMLGAGVWLYLRQRGASASEAPATEPAAGEPAAAAEPAVTEPAAAGEAAESRAATESAAATEPESGEPAAVTEPAAGEAEGADAPGGPEAPGSQADQEQEEQADREPAGRRRPDA
jgi:hypothetical protein